MLLLKVNEGTCKITGKNMRIPIGINRGREGGYNFLVELRQVPIVQDDVQKYTRHEENRDVKNLRSHRLCIVALVCFDGRFGGPS
jgi:hypothetical protein